VSPPATTPDAGVDYCQSLAAQYAAALPAARQCSTGTQCGNLVSTYLSPCPACTTYVSDPSALNALRHQWLQAGCENITGEACIGSVCPQVVGFACAPGDGGQGSCTAVYSSGAPLSD
jgi:hypothetical protein